MPMDDAQADHLKAYGVAFRLLERGGRAEWFLNYRGGSFLLPGDAATARDAALAGVTTEPVDDGAVLGSGPRSAGEHGGGAAGEGPEGGGLRAARTPRHGTTR